MNYVYFLTREYLGLRQMTWNQQRNSYGKQKELELQKTLENFLRESLVRTEGKFDKHDYIGDTWDVELKCRQPPCKTTDRWMKDGWVIPICKFQELTKKTIAFYYFESENRLFYIVYDKEVFGKFRIDKAPRTEQLHYYIPEQFWSEIVI